MRDPMKRLEKDPIATRAILAKAGSKGFGAEGVEALLTPKEVARLMSVSVDMVYKLVRQGELDAVHIGRLVRIRPGSYEKLIGRVTALAS